MTLGSRHCCCDPRCLQVLVVIHVFGRGITGISQQVLLWWFSPIPLCTTAPFGLHPNLVSSVTDIVPFFSFLILKCCKINWKATIMFPISFFCLHILDVFCLHVFTFPLLIFSFIASMKLLFSIFMSLDISEKPSKTFLIAASSWKLLFMLNNNCITREPDVPSVPLQYVE